MNSNFLSGLGGQLLQVLTGTDPNTLAQQMTAAEQSIALAVEAGLFLLFIIALELFVIIRNTSK